MDPIDTAEIEVICSNCDFPTVVEYDETGKVKSFREEPAPKELEAALKEGWLDHGMGLFCPRCSLTYLEDLAKDKAEGATSGIGGDAFEVFDVMALRSLCPDLSEDTYAQFTKMYRGRRLAKARATLNLPMINIPAPFPKDDAQAQEFMRLVEAIQVAEAKKEAQPE